MKPFKFEIGEGVFIKGDTPSPEPEIILWQIRTADENRYFLMDCDCDEMFFPKESELRRATKKKRGK